MIVRILHTTLDITLHYVTHRKLHCYYYVFIQFNKLFKVSVGLFSFI